MAIKKNNWCDGGGLLDWEIMMYFQLKHNIYNLLELSLYTLTKKKKVP